MLISKTKIKKILGTSLLLLTFLSIFLPFNKTLAVDPKLTAETILPTSAILKAVGLTPGKRVIFGVFNKNTVPPQTPATPYYEKHLDATVGADGSAWRKFEDLTPNRIYRAEVVTPSTGASTTLDEFKTLKNSEGKITSFKIVSGLTNSTGVINEGMKTIAIDVPTKTDVTNLAPTIIVSENATVSPASLIPQNFTNPVVYKVTAEDGSTTWNYTAAVTVLAPIPSKTCPPPQVLDTIKNICVLNTDTTYTLLTPLPGLGLDGTSQTIDTAKTTAQPCPFGYYLNIMIKLFLGICGVLAVIMIVMGGIQYMTSELVSSKEEGKKSITNAIFGLLLALGAYLILNTINPNLLNICLNNLPKASITITADEKLFSKTEENVKKVGANYLLAGTFIAPSPSAGVSDFKNKLSSGGHITGIVINTVSNRATFSGTDSSNKYISVSLPIKIGQNGVSDVSTAKEGDGKTPKGTYSITSDRRPSSKPPIDGTAALSRDGTYNMGAAFINYGATIGGKDRGMGFHGRFESGLGSVTNGCIRMSNDDLVALSPYMVSGTKVVIE
jgi:lipoprotein-anchoring transpeptidase ErfK/SrfK